jgi:predicted Zn-dependent peptidase
MVRPHEFEVNGAKVALYPMESVQAVALEAKFRAGSWHEEGDSWGGMHLLEHMVHQGTEQLPDVYAKDMYKEDHGIFQNAYTGGSTLGFDLNFPTVSLKQGINLFVELAFKATLPESRLSHEQSIIAQEYRDKWSNPTQRYYRENRYNFYGKNHIYVRDGMGNIDYVNTLTQKQLVELQKKYFVTSNMTLGIAGNFDVKEAEKLVREILSPLPQGQKQTYKIPKPKTKKEILFHKEDVDRVSIDIECFLPGRETFSVKERFTKIIANFILGGGNRSRIYNRLRNELGIVYSAGSGISFSNGVSDFGMRVSVSPEKAADARKELMNIFETFVTSGATETEFSRARNFINMRTMMSFDSPYSIAKEIANDLFWDAHIYMPDEYVAMANEITLEEINQSFKELEDAKFVTSVLSRNLESI